MNDVPEVYNALRQVTTQVYRNIMTNYHDLYITTYNDIMSVRNALRLSEKDVQLIEGHPHGNRARDRQIALNTIGEIASALKLELYSVSTGLREEQRGWEGSKEHHFLSDLTMPIRTDKLSDNHLIALIDVDYYIPQATFEKYAGHKIVIFTVNVNAVGGYDKESMWWVEGNTFTEEIAGGAKWKHHAWNYSGATCIIRDIKRDERNVHWLLKRKDIDNGFWMYHVERLHLPDTNKMIVFLNPHYHCRYPWRLMTAERGEKQMAEQQLYQVPTVTQHTTNMGKTRLAYFGGPNPYVSLSYLNPSRIVVKIPADIWEGLVARRNIVTTFGSQIVNEHLRQVGSERNPAAIILITTALCDVPENINFVGYTADTDYMNEPRNVAKLTVPPVIPPAAASAQTAEDLEKIVKTLKEVRNEVRFDKEMRGWAHEFSVETAKRTPWTLLEHDETIKIMLKANPNRKDEINKMLANPRNIPVPVTATMKAETVAGAAASGKNGRLILPTSTHELYHATRIMYPWCAQAHRDGEGTCGHFYLCGNDPTTIANKVVQAVQDAESNGNVLTPTDFNKFDLHNSKDTRKCFTESVALGCNDPTYANEVRRIINTEIDKMIKFKVKSNKNKPDPKRIPSILSGTMNLSGAGDTTALNLHTNALISYLTMRRLGFDHLTAYNSIRPKYGDDGLEEHVVAWKETAEKLGFTCTIEEREDNTQPIEFLSRIYVAPLLTNSSICAPKRALSKLPTTCSEKPLDVARYDKAHGYFVTDGHTPLVGAYAKAIMRVYGQGKKCKKTGNSSEEREYAWKIARGPAPFDDAYLEHATMVVAQQLGMSVEEVEGLSKAYDAAQNPEDMVKLATKIPSTVAPGLRPLP